jgi:TnpA family transposase
MFLFTKYKVSNSLTLAFVILGVVLTVMFLNNYFKVNNEYNEIEEIGNINNKV